MELIKFQIPYCITFTAVLLLSSCSVETPNSDRGNNLPLTNCMVSIHADKKLNVSIIQSDREFDDFIFDLSCQFSINETGLMGSDRPVVQDQRSIYLPSNQECPAFQKKVQRYIEKNYDIFDLTYGSMTIEDYFAALLEYNRTLPTNIDNQTDPVIDTDLDKPIDWKPKIVVTDLPVTVNKCPKY